MASPTEELKKFAQSVHLVIKNRYFDEIESEDGQVFVQQVCDWVNMYIDELENVVNPADGKLIDWWFARESQAALGTASVGDDFISAPSTMDRLITDEKRYVRITVDGTLVSQWLVVQPRQLSNKNGVVQSDKCAVVGGNIQFSRPFTTAENGGAITGDIVSKLSRITFALGGDGFTVNPQNIKILTTVRPKALLQLGVAKNATLPDIVQGGLSPSYVQKYNDLLSGALARSNATSEAQTVERDDFSGVRGAY